MKLVKIEYKESTGWVVLTSKEEKLQDEKQHVNLVEDLLSLTNAIDCLMYLENKYKTLNNYLNPVEVHPTTKEVKEELNKYIDEKNYKRYKNI